MPDSKSDEQRSVVEAATCLAEMFGALQLAELASWFQQLFGKSPAGPMWDRFKMAYVISVLESKEAKAAAVQTAVVGFMTLAFTASTKLDLIDLFCDLM